MAHYALQAAYTPLGWAALLKNPQHRAEIVEEVRAVAAELAETEDESLGPDDATRTRFREFARRELGD